MVNLLSGKLVVGEDVLIGENVTVNVAEEMVLGDRAVLADNSYFEGRRISIGQDFFGYQHWNKRLEVGRGRRDCEDAVLEVGHRNTWHENRIDLAERVWVGDDVGLSPEVVLYTHGYWQSPLEGFPCRYASVRIGKGTIVGFRSTLMPGSSVPANCVVGACSVVCGALDNDRCVYAGSPARLINKIISPPPEVQVNIVRQIMAAYQRSLKYRGLTLNFSWIGTTVNVGTIRNSTAVLDLAGRTLAGDENEFTDDLRWFLFSRGIRIYTKRRFRKLEKR